MRVFYCPAGRIEVGVSARFEASRAVRISVPSESDLTPDSARAVAIALIEHAAYAERRNQQQKGAS